VNSRSGAAPGPRPASGSTQALVVRLRARPVAAALLLFVLLAAPLAAQSGARPDSLLEHLAGRWVLEGRIAGRQTVHDVTAAWVLGHEYLQLHEVSREHAPSGAPAYEAIIYVMWDAPSRQYACLWLDNTAAAPFDPGGVGHGTPAGDSIPFIFRDSSSDGFRNTFVYDRATDTWQWHMDNEHAGALQPFGRVTLRRR
jgi:hypothetical protein